MRSQGYRLQLELWKVLLEDSRWIGMEGPMAPSQFNPARSPPHLLCTTHDPLLPPPPPALPFTLARLASMLYPVHLQAFQMRICAVPPCWHLFGHCRVGAVPQISLLPLV